MGGLLQLYYLEQSVEVVYIGSGQLIMEQPNIFRQSNEVHSWL